MRETDANAESATSCTVYFGSTVYREFVFDTINSYFPTPRGGASLLKAETKDQPGISISNIVFATDLLESSRLALDYAVAFAHHYDALLTIVHAFELSTEAREVEMAVHVPSISREQMLSRLKALATGVLRLGVRAEIDLREGDVRNAVLKSVEENNADLLILGTHGIYRGLEHVLLGSNAEKILLSSPCPTLTIGRHVMAGLDLDLNFKRILVVTSDSLESAAATIYATALGSSLGLDIEEHRISGDNPDAQKTLERALVCPDSLLVLGVRNRSSWSRHLHTSLAFELVGKSSCPVLSIRER